MTAALLLLRAFFGGIFKFVQANYKWVLPLLAGLLLWWYVTHLQGQRDDAIHDLVTLKQGIADAAVKREHENAIKQTQAAAAANANEHNHKREIDQLRRTSHDQTNIAVDDRNNAWRERMRLDLASRLGMPEDKSHASGLAESGGECDATAVRQTLEQLEIACAITTADYNACKTWGDDTCAIYGCE